MVRVLDKAGANADTFKRSTISGGLWVKCGIAECGMLKVKCGIKNAE